ncbi:glutathione-specific gamma-glutamylcyclotransferase [Aspergillus lentulus]|uniref:glutathione-specific gamma-glutamylcyclotransferase n=1 Tax=Aspergillus lentulus TaxID=293939 RepID=A0ABQ1AJ51_ASPLE|nr:glutathione-specific gamma-glutamylcyclotransferase [Aspergillus lentulus]GFF38709.1 glutathione-specific gamma-glutamylcyclotransferase [Aspergillus lentulus]GFF68650.1 glutathione-specific gamma-glutamylcyclotransferase [Aspergillus lentulus]GFF82878.1 glutathione-specific gamma-glutamylcyclotransferase [Aspergillus lentulus]GFF91396.1 glutathione-specific gamma-glutamylcyclotransferase [Aspergillus lentulus]GFG13542.1 glutathione-specific gamma-glutamylcyclotransferase [Aspergillus lentu
MTTPETTQSTPAGRTWRNYFPDGDLWVFGYGSLIWKPPPHYDQRVPGYIDGYVRRFWQASTDHRGTPEAPGRVVTVIERGFWETLDDPHGHLESSTARVWGAAYHIPASHAEEVHDYLDEREIDGYTVHYTPFHPISAVSVSTVSRAPETGTVPETQSPSQAHAAPITCMVYIGQPSNPQFLRDPARREPQDVAEVISRGRGQSGKNTEYLYLLEKALEGLGLGSADMHVTDLVRRVKTIESTEEATAEQAAAERDVKESLEASWAEAHRDPSQIE